MGWGSILGGAVGSVFGPVGTAVGAGLGGYLEQDQANSYNSAQASRQMDFQSQMRSTSYQTAMADMRAAGLNPMLAFSQGGASVPAGAMASYASVEPASSAQAALAQSSKVPDEIELLRANTGNVRQQTRLLVEQTDKAIADAGMAHATAAQLYALNRAIAGRYGVQFSGLSNTEEALSKFMRQTKVDPDIQDAAAQVALRSNEEDLQKLLNAPAANVAMQFMQLLLKGAMVLKSGNTSHTSRVIVAPTK